MEHNYIPLFCEELYFVLDTTNRYLYPCTQRIYNYFVSYDKKQLKDKSECDEELSAFLSMLIDVENNVKYAPIKYDEVTRKDVLLSLARVPHITLEITRKCNLACVYCCNGKLYKHVGAQCDVWNLHAYTSEEIEEFRKRNPNASEVLLASNNMVNDLWKKKFHDPLCVIDRLLYKNTDLRLGNCFLFSTRVFISISGELYLCEKSSRNFKFGKVHKDVLYIYLKRINGYYKDIGNILYSHCLSCYKNDRCECCYFAENETITQNKCFYSREQAINDFHSTIK